ncbi:MAG: hypothetical protein M1833_002127 [Piccolia ochrophora]|nr:MAG: hypothetical protein M1833_002127 [Piccolia ochrophora]
MVRIKHRYLLVHVLSPAETDNNVQSASTPTQKLPAHVLFQPPIPFVTPALLAHHIRSHIATLYGDHGVGVTSMGLAVKYLSPLTATFILRCPLDSYRLVWAALAFMTTLPVEAGRRPCVLRVVRTSGTIRKVEEEAVRRAREGVGRAVMGVGGGGALLGLSGGDGQKQDGEDSASGSESEGEGNDEDSDEEMEG